MLPCLIRVCIPEARTEDNVLQESPACLKSTVFNGQCMIYSSGWMMLQVFAKKHVIFRLSADYSVPIPIGECGFSEEGIARCDWDTFKVQRRILLLVTLGFPASASQSLYLFAWAVVDCENPE